MLRYKEYKIYKLGDRSVVEFDDTSTKVKTKTPKEKATKKLNPLNMNFNIPMK